MNSPGHRANILKGEHHDIKKTDRSNKEALANTAGAAVLVGVAGASSGIRLANANH
jgi:hypothetical protein